MLHTDYGNSSLKFRTSHERYEDLQGEVLKQTMLPLPVRMGYRLYE